MKFVRTFSAALAALLIVIYADGEAAVHRSADVRSSGAAPAPGVVPGVIIIKMKKGSPDPASLFLKSAGFAGRLMKSAGILSVQPAFRTVRPLSDAETKSGNVDLSLIYFARLGAGLDPVGVARVLDRSGEFEYVEPKYMHSLRDVPNDSAFAFVQSSYFGMMNAMNGWSIAKGDTNVVIADVDGGTFWAHPDLMPNLWINKAEDANHDGRFEHGSPPAGDENGVDDDHNGFVDDVIGWNFANNSNDPVGIFSTPENAAHGSATASDFGAVTNNGVGMAGSSWNCRVMLINAASPAEDNSIAFAYEGIQYAFANGAKVINCSFGRPGAASRFEQDVINAATQAGALVVSAAGNDASNSDFVPQYPANYPNVLAVGATNSGNDGRAGFSNYGTTVPVYAPGVGILGIAVNGGYRGGWDGTSFSSPLVAGLAGLLKSSHSSWTPRQIATQIRITADSIDNSPLNPGLAGMLGRGRVNFARALQESHAGIEIVRSSLLSPSGDRLFLPGDTLVLKLTVRNIMFVPAADLSFTATTSDRVVEVLQGTTAPTTLAPGDSIVLPDFLFKLGPVGVEEDVLIRLSWVSNFNERDAFAFKARVFPTAPLWQTQKSPTTLFLSSIAAVNRNVAWSAGGNPDGSAPVVLRTVDQGTTWKDVTANLRGVVFYCISAIDSSRAWVGSADGRIFATLNGGASWSEQPYPGIQSPFIDGIKMFSDLSGYALGDPDTATPFVILKTTNGGSSWAHLTNEPVASAGEAGWNNSFWWTDRLHGWFGTSKARIWRTTDGGGTWLAGATPLTNSVGVAFGDNLHGIAGYPGGSLTATSDGGASWGLIPSPTNGQIAAVAAAAGSQFFWVTDGTNPYQSTNAGGFWATQSYYPLDGSIDHIAFTDTGTGWFVTTLGEIFHYSTDTSTVEPPPPPEIPTSFALLQNYPNPFNPGTFLPFRLPVDSHVSIHVFDILGRRVRVAVDGNFVAGDHVDDVKFDATGLASGVYFYRINAEPLVKGSASSFQAVRKMMVLR